MSFESAFRASQARPEWFDRALCAPVDGIVDPDVVAMFFPNSSDMGGADRHDVNATVSYELDAKAICAACPVRSECLEFGLDEPTGIWGGRSARERRYIRRRLRGATA